MTAVIDAIVEDVGRLREPRPVGPARQRLLLHLRAPLTARELARRSGVNLAVVRVLLSQMHADRQVVIVYRRIVEYAGPRGRRRHVVGYYMAAA